MKKFVSVIFVLNFSATDAQIQEDSNKKWSYHFQFTTIDQAHPAFRAKYSGENSLLKDVERSAISVTSTLYLGRKLWKNASVYFNPELAGGEGISSAKGIAGFTNGETFRIGSPAPAIYLARLYFQQHFALGNSRTGELNDDANQVAETVPDKRLTIIAGKFCLADFFDDNDYSHDPRKQFLNWSLMSNGAWDYPANTRGYTTGIVIQYADPKNEIRLSGVTEPKLANGLKLDYHITKTYGATLEFQRKWKMKRPGAVRLLAFRNVTQAPTYAVTLKNVKAGDSSSVDVYRGEKGWSYGGTKYGFGLNVQQEISNDAGIFFRAGWNDGKTATWAYTEIDRTISLGINITGAKWKRNNDFIGIAQVVNGISKDHRDFLKAGLYGFIIGDGNLNYRTEQITEIYYSAKLAKTFFLSGNYQFVSNPGYNHDRGPVHVFAVRGHLEF